MKLGGFSKSPSFVFEYIDKLTGMSADANATYNVAGWEFRGIPQILYRSAGDEITTPEGLS